MAGRRKDPFARSFLIVLTLSFLLLPSSRRGKNPAVNKNVFRDNPGAGSLGRQVTLRPEETKDTQEGKDKKGENQECWNTPVISALSRLRQED